MLQGISFASRNLIARVGRIGWNSAIRWSARIRHPQTRADFRVHLALETPVEVLVGEKKSKTDDSIPTWLSGLGSETPEQRLAFQNWLACSEGLNAKYKERIEQGLLRIIRGECKQVH